MFVFVRARIRDGARVTPPPFPAKNGNAGIYTQYTAVSNLRTTPIGLCLKIVAPEGEVYA